MFLVVAALIGQVEVIAAPGKVPSQKPSLTGKVVQVASDGKGFTLEAPPTRKGEKPARHAIELQARTEITYFGVPREGEKPTVGYIAVVWLKANSTTAAAEVRLGLKNSKPQGKKKPPLKPAEESKPAAPRPEAPVRPRTPRDPAPVAAFVDREIDQQLTKLKITPAPRADDAEFLRRVSLDLTGRIPTYRRALAFLDSPDPHKRRQLIDELLASPEYGEHFATIWRNLIEAREEGSAKYQKPVLAPWLAREFNRNRGWNDIVSDLLTASGPLRDSPQNAFLLANMEGFKVQPNLIASATARLFWGIRLGCAECHDHPFARWKQTDFWATAAFFSRVRFSGFKNVPEPFLTEEIPDGKLGKRMRQGVNGVRGAAIEIPASARRGASRVVKARFLGGAEADLDHEGPFRPRFAAWATAGDNPFFARATANRLWAHLFGRGLVHPVDGFEDNSPSHPRLLDRLAAELAASNFDQKHLLRCLILSKAYQRTSRPPAGEPPDSSTFSHMALKVMTPEVFFDSLKVVTALDKSDKDMVAVPAKKAAKAGKGRKDYPLTREFFARQLRATGDETEPTEYAQGIPQFLKLMNAPLLNSGAPLIDKLCRTEVSRAEGITTLYLATLSRRPTAEELKLMTAYMERRNDARTGYQGVLWILLNSSEFILTH
jgi:hypothetical protein